MSNPNPIHERLLRQFSYAHLPESLKLAARPFQELAQLMVETATENPNIYNPADVTVALRKLLEAKDAFVRATLP